MSDFTVADAIAHAKSRAGGRVCLDLLRGRSPDEAISTEEMDELANALFYDTLYWEGLDD